MGSTIIWIANLTTLHRKIIIAMSAQRRISKTMNILIWVTQGILAVTFIWAGAMKLFKPEDLPFPWVKDHPDLVVLTGVVDLLGGLGIVLPAMLRIQPRLTVFAAYGIIALMTLATIFHISRGEAKDIGFNIFMLSLAVFVAWGRPRST